MPIFKNNNKIIKLYKGTSLISKVYQGDKLVYGNDEPEPEIGTIQEMWINTGLANWTDATKTAVKFKRDSEIGKIEILPGVTDGNKLISGESMFWNTNIGKITPFDTSNITNMSSMFSQMTIETKLWDIDCSSCVNMLGMFNQTKQIEITLLNTEKVENYFNFAQGSNTLITLNALNASNVTTSTNLNGLYSTYNLVNFGGWIGAKVSFNLNQLTKLSHNSLINILNGLADLTGQNPQTCTLGTTNLNKLSISDKEIAIDKNWILN